MLGGSTILFPPEALDKKEAMKLTGLVCVMI